MSQNLTSNEQEVYHCACVKKQLEIKKCYSIMSENITRAHEQEVYHVHPKYNLYAGNMLGSVINIKTRIPVGRLTSAGYIISVKGDNDERIAMFKKDFIYTLFCDDIPEGERVYHYNGKVTDDNIENLSLQDEFQPHPVFDLYEANDRGIIRNRKTKKVIGFITNMGYLMVTVRETTTNQVNCYNHRFVYEVFCGIIPKNLVINHINNVKTDNRLENLELVTQKENVKKGRGGNGSNFRCPAKPVISLNLETDEEMKFKSISAAAKHYKINPRAVKFVADGTTKSAFSSEYNVRICFRYDD